MPKNPLDNIFESGQERIDDHDAFVRKVLGSSKIVRAGKKTRQKEDWNGADVNLNIDPKKLIEEKIFGEIYSREQKALKNFFGEEMKIPALPDYVTPERIGEWDKIGFDLHYLPPILMAAMLKDKYGVLQVKPKPFPGWREMLENEIDPTGINVFTAVKVGDMGETALTLPGCWILFDRTPKPDLNEVYQKDVFAQDLEFLREAGVFSADPTSFSRLQISINELQSPAAMRVFAETLKVGNLPKANVLLPSIIEYNVLGNLYYPQLGRAPINEWFRDLDNSRYTLGGSSEFGGLEYVNSLEFEDARRYVEDADPYKVGFRLIVHLSS
ncbi:MAG TPA: hypothetical protein VFQ60_01245 [Patescibacteria group bacterium]|nr:hypothetical protein [Patescibacteria group bacterium]